MSDRFNACEPDGGACRAIPCPPSRAVAHQGIPLTLTAKACAWAVEAASLPGKAASDGPLASVLRAEQRLKGRPASPVLRVIDPLTDSRRRIGAACGEWSGASSGSALSQAGSA